MPPPRGSPRAEADVDRAAPLFASATPLAFVASLVLAPLATGCGAVNPCGTGNVMATNKSTADVDDRTATCKVARDPLNPIIALWLPTNKASLERGSRDGIVVVSYVGCTLKILEGCVAKGSYAYTGVTPARDRIDIGSTDELYARLPLGAVGVKAELDRNTALRFDYIAVGQRIADGEPKALAGQCEGATHYVRTITLGAYSLDRPAKASAGGEGEPQDARIDGSGDVAKCSIGAPATEEAAEKSGCGAPLQLDLAPLRVTTQGDVVAGSFGEGLGALSNGPGEDGIDIATANALDVDAGYLALLGDAKRADRDKATKPIEKANAWGALADYKGKNPTKAFAAQRRDAWKQQAADLEKLKNQYLTDKTTLDKLVALDDEILPKEKKEAYEREFAEVYSPWNAELELAMGVPIAPLDGTTTPPHPAESEMGDVQIQAEGGMDVQQLTYAPTVASSAGSVPVYDSKARDAKGNATLFTGDAGAIGGFAGLVLTLPRIPAPGWGLSVLARYAFAAEVSRITADAGIKFMSKGFAGGLYVGYAKLLNVKDSGQGCDRASGTGTASTPSCLVEDQLIANGSSGGFDARVDLGYQFLVGKILTLSVGGGLGYALFPYKVTGTTGPTTTKQIDASDIAKGISATLQAGIGLRL